MAKKIKVINLLGSKCYRCGNDDIVVLAFHHKKRGKKEILISLGLEKNRCELEREVRKCILLCCNCHQELHFPKTSSIKIKLLQIKKVDRCEKCGHKGISASSLSFHHINGNKHFWISSFCNYTRGEIVGVSIEEMYRELKKCVVLCENCHRKEHFDFVRFNRLKPYIDEKILNYRARKANLTTSKNAYVNRTNESRIICLRKEGGTVREIANITGYGTITVEKVLKRHNFVGRVLINWKMIIPKIVSLRKKGWKVSEIAKKINCSIHTVSRAIYNSSEIKAIIVRQRRERRRIAKKIVREFKRGKTLSEIAKITGYCAVSVSRILKQQGISIPHRVVDVNKILQLRRDGLTLKMIAEKAGCSECSVSLVLKKSNCN